MGSDITFPIERLNPQGYGRGPDHDYDLGQRSEICASCVEELDATDNSAAMTAIDPAVRFIYPNVEADLPADIIAEMLEQARDGSAGPKKKGLYERLFAANGTPRLMTHCKIDNEMITDFSFL